MLDSTRNISLAFALSALAGYIDGIGFIHLHGLFVSFMSGNSTRMGVSLADGHIWDALSAGWLILLFVGGAALGNLVIAIPMLRKQAMILFVEAAILTAASVAALFNEEHTAVALIVLAMGLENAVFQVEGGAGIGLTYMTGALVKVGQLFAKTLMGGPRWAWMPNLGLWAALVVGSTIGALVYQRFALLGIWFGAAACFALAAWVAFTHATAPKPA
jgi:uncharacterized membrane protein YoaK (UPF0700 family)